MTVSELPAHCKAVIKQSERITPESTDEVRHIVLAVDDPAFRYHEGESIGVLIPGPHEFGNPYHLRRYSIANARPQGNDDEIELSILVRRCFYVDSINGEQYPGLASNYLCDADAGDELIITGPYRSPFQMPESEDANILMIGAGTGIAPFRAFIEQIYRQHGGWKGEVRLYYGAKDGTDLYYMNRENSDLSLYFDQPTFKAFEAVAGRYLDSETDGLQQGIESNADAIWELINDSNSHLFLAGLEKVGEGFDSVMSRKAGSDEAWQALKERMQQEGRWSELLYS